MKKIYTPLKEKKKKEKEKRLRYFVRREGEFLNGAIQMNLNVYAHDLANIPSY